MEIKQRIAVFKGESGVPQETITVAIVCNDLKDAKRIMKEYGKESKAFMKCAEVAVADGITIDGKGKTTKSKAALKLAERQLKSLLNNTFNAPVYEAFFTHMGVRPFAKVKGQFYCEQILHALGVKLTEMLGGIDDDE